MKTPRRTTQERVVITCVSTLSHRVSRLSKRKSRARIQTASNSNRTRRLPTRNRLTRKSWNNRDPSTKRRRMRRKKMTTTMTNTKTMKRRKPMQMSKKAVATAALNSRSDRKNKKKKNNRSRIRIRSRTRSKSKSDKLLRHKKWWNNSHIWIVKKS